MAAKSKIKKTRAKAAPSPKKSASPKASKHVYAWGSGKADGNGGMKNLLGGKGANLAEMTRIGLPVPPGFTITTEVCTYFYANKRTYPKALQAQMEAALRNMERIMGYKFGDAVGFPLLVAVRSGARDSMPGMMDTILNLGLNDQTVLSLAKATKNDRFAWDCYRRFIQMYGDVVLGVQKKEGEDHEPFETAIETYKHEKYHTNIEDSKLTAEDQSELVKRFKALVLERTGHVFPNDPWDQLRGAAGASTGASTGFPPSGAPRSTCRPWSMATPGRPPDLESRSPATRQTGRMSSTGSSLSTRRARMSWPASARPSRCSS
jgi:pyruvate,orthophosphate dikinase